MGGDATTCPTARVGELVGPGGCTVKFGIMFANTGAGAEAAGAVALAKAAEDAGFESIWAIEHVLVPQGYESQYPYDASGRMMGSDAEDIPMPDPLIWLSYIAAVTTRIQLATGVMILPQRNPAILAKEVATLDQLSGGRMNLGVGVGWLEEEFDALGVPFARRGARTDDNIAAMRALWAPGAAVYEGEFTRYDGVFCNPRPPRGSVPIIIGGHSKLAARRAGRLGDGFFPGKGGPTLLGELFDVVRRTAEESGRDPAAIEMTCGGKLEGSYIERLASLGVSRMILGSPGLAEIERLGTDLVDKFADLEPAIP